MRSRYTSVSVAYIEVVKKQHSNALLSSFVRPIVSAVVGGLGNANGLKQ